MADPAEGEETLSSAIRASLGDIDTSIRRIARAIQYWYQNRHFINQIVIVVVVWFGGNAVYNFIAPRIWAIIGDFATAALGFQITGLTVIQFIIVLLGYIIAQNFILIRRVNNLETVIEDMDQTAPVADGGGQPRDDMGRFKEKDGGTSGGGFVGGAIIGGAIGASFGPGGMVAGALAGALLGDALEQQSSKDDD